MAEDVLEFCHKRSLQHISLLGHSMCVLNVYLLPSLLTELRGGKVAMAVALNPDLPVGLLSHLIVSDMAPSRGPLSPEFRGYVEAMKKIEKSQVTTRKEAQNILIPYERVRIFLDSLILAGLILLINRMYRRGHSCSQTCSRLGTKLTIIRSNSECPWI